MASNHEDLVRIPGGAGLRHEHCLHLAQGPLKWRYDPTTEPRHGWRMTIRNARLDIPKRAVGSLGNYPGQYLATAHRHAREDAADATALPLRTFPLTCPWSVEEVLDPNYWPDEPTQAVESARRGRPRVGPGSIGPRSR